MHIGFLTDGLGSLPLEQALDIVAELGLTEVEIATGNWSQAPHIELDELVLDARKRRALADSLADHGLRLGALNASGNVLHPTTGPEQDRVARQTMLLAEQLGVDTIVMMSGLPAVHDGDRVAPWITTCWPPENGENLERQWETAVRHWGGLAAFADVHGIRRIALEMHADQLVFNTPTLLRLRGEVGDILGANMDPSHLMWMGADPIASVRALSGAIHHVHAKDTRIEAAADTRTRLETLFFDRRAERAWNYVTLGEGNPGGVGFWSEFCRALQESGYDGVLSIEHEDVAYPAETGLAKAITALRQAMPSPRS